MPVSTVVAIVFTFFFINWMIGIFNSFLGELLQERGLRSSGVFMVSRYQRKPETYDRAALLFYNWVIFGEGFTIRFTYPKGFVHFLRCYRRVTVANLDLRESLFNAVLVKVLALGMYRRGMYRHPDWTLLIDAVYTGSEAQKGTIKVFSDSNVAMGQNIEPLVSKIESAHKAGTDTRGSDLSMPPPAILFRQILDPEMPIGEMNDICLRAARSQGYCEELVAELKMVDLPDRQRLAGIVRSRSEPLAVALGKELSASTVERIYFKMIPHVMAIPVHVIVILLGICAGSLIYLKGGLAAYLLRLKEDVVQLFLSSSAGSIRGAAFDIVSLFLTVCLLLLSVYLTLCLLYQAALCVSRRVLRIIDAPSARFYRGGDFAIGYGLCGLLACLAITVWLAGGFS